MDVDDLEVPLLPIGVRVVPLTQRKTAEPLRLEGRFAASRAVQIKAPSSGLVAGLELSLGDMVERDALICTIGALAHEQRGLASEAQLHLLEAQFEERKDSLALARARGGPADRLESFESKLRAAEHRVLQERAQVRRFGVLARAIEVRAPFDARVSAVSVASGASIVTGNPLVELVEIDPAVLVLEVPTWVASKCPRGTVVTVEADSQTEPLTGRISRWAPTASDNVRRVLIDVDNPDGMIAAGEQGVAVVDVGERDAFFAPRLALHHDKKRTRLQLVEHSRVQICDVRVIGGDDREVEVAGKLSTSQLVVLYSERPLKESSEVVIRGDH